MDCPSLRDFRNPSISNMPLQNCLCSVAHVPTHRHSKEWKKRADILETILQQILKWSTNILNRKNTTKQEVKYFTPDIFFFFLLFDLIPNNKSSVGEWGIITVTCHTKKVSIIFGSFQSNSHFTLSKVVLQKGQEQVTGIAMEPYNGLTMQEGLMIYQPPSGIRLFTHTLAWWNICHQRSWPTFKED